MSSGWVSIHRSLTDSEFWLSERFTKPQAWLDLVINANHAPGSFWVRGIEVKLERGQIGWSEITMTKRWQWSREKVRTFLKYLENDRKIRQQKRLYVTTIITINNYEAFQQANQQTVQQTVQQKDSKPYINNKNKQAIAANDKKDLTSSKDLIDRFTLLLGDSYKFENNQHYRKTLKGWTLLHTPKNYLESIEKNQPTNKKGVIKDAKSVENPFAA